MNCVNKSSKEFKSLAAKHNVSDNTLELIVHKYWREKSSEELFPSDSYIQAQLGAIPYEESVKAAKELWQKKYSGINTYDTLDDLQSALSEVSEYFPAESIIYYKDANGKYSLLIKEPVANLDKALDDIQKKGYLEARKEDIGIKNNEEYGIDKVEELFNKFNTDRTSKPLADKIFKLVGNLGLKVVFSDNLGTGNAGAFGHNTITLSKDFFENSSNNEKKAATLLHEMIHAVTTYAMSDKVDAESLFKPLQEFRNEIHQLFKELQYNPSLKDERGVLNEREFVAELANPIFRQKIQAIDNGRKQSFWQRIVDAVKNLLGIHSSSPYYTRMMNTLDKAINAFDVKTYMEYTKLTDALKQNNKGETIDYNTLSTDDLKKEIHDYVDNLPENAALKETYHSLINSLTEKDINDIYSEIEQNRKDTNLVVNKIRQIAKEKLSKEKKKFFTFKDGKSVKAPFVPNDQQVDALNKINDFLHSNKSVMTLSGYAGTGKTSIMEMIAEKAKKDGMMIAFTASTNKATQVLESKVSHIGFPVMTANKAFGIALEPGDKAEYDADDLKITLVENKIDGFNAAIIDEASMISQDNFDILTNIAKETGLKIIFVGDVAQLPPVERETDSSKLSPVFTNKQGDVITLTKVERTGDNAILKEATNLRNGDNLTGVSSFNKEGKGIAYIKPGSQERDKIIEAFAPKMKEDPDYFRILTYTNKSVAQYNDTVRRLLGYNDNTPRVGETILGYTNFDYNERERKYGFINSGSYKVVNVLPSQVRKININGQYISLEVTPVTIKGIDGKSHTYEMVDIKENEANKKAVIPIAEALTNLWTQWKASTNRKQKASILSTINYIEQFLFVNDNITNERGRKLFNKVFDFGYAMTIHKSQGSTFKNVLLDDINIAMYNKYLDKDAIRRAAASVHPSADLSDSDLSKSGMANAHSNIDNAVVSGTMELNLFDDDSTPITNNVQPTTTTQDEISNMVDIRRQLEYVGVSRATDTVTIISNDVKKEGSPLHPETALSSTTSTTPTKPTVSTKPISSMSSMASIDSITPQLIEHLKSIGIDVNDRAAMEKYLKEHGYENIQFVRPSYNSQLTFAKGVKRPKEGVAGLSSTIMEQANIYFKLTPDLKDSEKTVKKITLYGNYAYLWSTENGYEFFVEKSLAINERNCDEIFKLIDQYGIDSKSDGIIRSIQKLGNRKERVRRTIDALKRRGLESYSNKNRQFNGQQRGETSNGTGDNGNIISNTEREEINKFVTPSGEVYGFVTPDGRMFLDETKINPEHPIHEYTHLWDRALMRTNIRLWNRGVELMKQTSLWKAIEEDANYGAKWKAQGLSQTELDNLIASEVHARFVGEGGAKLLEQLAKEKGQEGIIAKLKDWILDVWKSLTATFSDWSEDEINKLTLKDFNHMTMRDFAEGINPNTINPVQKVLSDKKIDMQKTLSLPNFEHFVYNRAAKDLKGIEIDYPWKGQYLKDLDSQFRRMDSEDDEIYMSDDDKQFNQKLIDKMKVILNAKDKDDYLDKEQREKKEDIQSALSDYDRLNQQYANLLNGMTEEDGLKYIDSPLKVSEIRHIAELSMDYISDTISDIQATEGLAEKLFPNVKPEEGFDFTKAERADIINTIGIENLLGYAKDKFNTEKNDWFDEVENFDDAALKADFIRNNWEAIVKIGSDIFAFNEGIGIARNYGDHKFKTTKENLQIDIDNFNGNTDEDSLNETEGDAQEHWQVDFRTVDTINSMSALVRQAIHECYKLDENGEPVMNPLFGIKERVDPRQVTNSILRWTQGSLTLEEMIEKLREKQKDNTWLSQLIKRLEDKSGNNADFQSQFFNVFCKHFQLYSIVIDQEGKFTCINANEHPALTEVMDSIKAKYRIGEHPLFSTNGKINRELLGKDEESYKKDDHAFNLYQAMSHLPQWNFRGMHIDVDMSEDKVAEYSEWLSKVAKALGFDATPDMIASVLTKDTLSTMVEKLHFIAHDLSSAIEMYEDKGKSYDPFKYKGGHDIGTAVQNFMAPIASILEDTTINAFYDSGKMYQSYVIPSFTTKLFQKFTKTTNENFDKFMEEEYGKSEWFGHKEWELLAGKEVTHYNVPWLKAMVDYRQLLDHRVQLNFNGHNYMRNLTDPEYALSVISEYFSEEQIRGKEVGWFRIPMESNKPSEEFIRFVAYKDQSHYKEAIVNDLYDMVLMEISRIQTVIMRNKSKGDEGFIKNFDTNGRQFNFFPFLNDYIEKGKQGTILKDADGNISDDNKVLADLLQRKISGLEENKLSTEEELQMAKLIKKVTKTYMQDRVNNMLDMFDRKGITEAAQKIKNIIDPDYLDTKDENGKELEGEALDKHNEFVNRKMKEALENFLWNDYLASKNILMMMVGDTAFYKDAEDLQKRLAELHAPGVRGNINATDYGDAEKGIEPMKVSSDGKYRTLILKDFDSFKSNIIANLTEVFDRKIAQAKESEKAGWIALKDYILRKPGTNGKDDKGGEYYKINVADAEGYSCMTSYRKKALMFGRWSKASEEIYKRILKSNYTYTDLKTAFQPMKPFVYTHLQKNMGVDKAPISMMYCPFQAKNSEVLLVMADALLRNENTSRPNILRAISNIMEDSAYDGRVRNALGEVTTTGTYNGKGIDTVQFESAIKSSLQTPIDLNQFLEDKENGEIRAYTELKTRIYKQGTTDYNTDSYVQEAPFEDYCIQQEIPEHFKNHSQAHGSQTRMIVPSDLDYYYDSTRDDEHLNDEDNIVKYEWTDDSHKKHSLNADEFRNHYESTIAENILDSLDKLAKEFHLTDSNDKEVTDKKERNIALSQILIKEIDSSPRYSIDLRWACSLNDEGEFNIPLGDPIQCKRIEQLINSIIKNRVNKQEIAGGPIVQVSNYGTSRQLHIRFNDKKGNLMPTEEEFNKAKEEGTLTDEQKKYSSYQDYIHENQGGVAYFEVFAPIWSDDIANKFMDKDGNIDMKAIEETNPELLKLITYRIPTEDKYSMAPCKIVGFMPREAGDIIMLPYELTTIDGSDFDIDKRYVMRKDYRIVVDDYKTSKYLYNRAIKELNIIDKEKLKNDISTFLSLKKRKDGEKFFTSIDKTLDKFYNDKEGMKHCYTTTKVEEGSKQFNDNEIVNMSWAVLTNPTSADKMLNPGGFELQKKVGYSIAAYKNPANADVSWDELHAMDTDKLKKLSYVKKDLAWFDTQMQFYKQNSAAASLIGIFAVNKIAHAVLETDKFYIDIPQICGSGFNIAGTEFEDRMEVDPRYDSKGNIIGKVLGSLVGASADAVKDPVLNLMNINITTAGILNTMVRLGLPFEDAAMFLSQDIISRVLDEFNKRNLSNYVTIDDLVKEFTDEIAADEHISTGDAINSEPIYKQELIDGLKEGDHKASDYKVLLAFSKLKSLTDTMRNITFATRFNSISSAVGPLIVDNLIMEHKIHNFMFKENADLSYITPLNPVITRDKDGNEVTNPASTGFYDKDGNIVDINTVWAAHPILEAFKSTVGKAHQIFNAANMPTNSVKFRTILASLEKYELTEKVFTDKKLLDQLSTFYQSYMLMASNLIDSKNLSYYINDFPKKFLKYQQEEKYKDNALIQVIKLNYSRKTKKPFLQIKITGMDAKQKEELSSAWVDLYKENPKLSNALFQYSFFRAGIGFSPKTFMALVPVYVKNHLSKTVDDETITYNDVYKGLFNDRIVNDNVIDQFIRNNWDNNKLVSWANVKDSKLSVNYNTKTLTASTDEAYAALYGKMYIKTSAYGRTYLWKKRGNSWSKKQSWIYDMVSPLGNNGEYLEISTNEIKQALADTKQVTSKDNQADSDIDNHDAIDDEASSTQNLTVPKSVVVKNLSTMAKMFMKRYHNLNEERSKNLILAYKANIDKGGTKAEQAIDIIQGVFKANDLNYNREETKKEFKKYC